MQFLFAALPFALDFVADLGWLTRSVVAGHLALGWAWVGFWWHCCRYVRSNLSKYDQTSWCICLKWINFGSVLVLYKSQGCI
ncbi:hypothetical protein CICLE_v10006346mg [Citrus x clementina]|uniref:Uncharacterized protein n=1 Tax=Citrus clementina TaxID=85681 RepID=V4SCN4_CITCL|nr:hypothetical protein CICLE_v10006346mg [Citrus x clementina]